MANQQSTTEPFPPPSDVARFIQKHFGTHPAGIRFSTPELAAQLGLSAFEAHEVLNNYADDGLLSFAGFDKGIESWQPSRNGLAVFGIGIQAAVRLDWYAVAAMVDAVDEAIPLIKPFAPMEISIGGRPVFGGYSGKFLVGVRLDHAPYQGVDDARLHKRLFDIIARYAALQDFSILLFSDLVPERLRKREVLHGPECGQVVVSPASAIDRNEKVFDRNFHRLLIASGPIDGRDPLRQPERVLLSQEFDAHLAVQALETYFPVSCKRSQAPVTDITMNFDIHDAVIRESVWGGPGNALRKWEELVLAKAEYAASTGGLDAYCRDLPSNEADLIGLPRSISIERAKGAIMTMLAEQAALRIQEREVNLKANATANAHCAPMGIRYYAVVDGLNFAGPHLVGYARHSPAEGPSIAELEHYWRSIILNMPNCPAAALEGAGQNGAELSLFFEPASAAQIQAFDGACERAGKTFRFLAVDADSFAAFQSSQENLATDIAYMGSNLPARTSVQPVRPKLLIGARHKGLFEVVRGMPYAFKEKLQALLLNSEDIRMIDFARSASRRPCTSLAVLASGYLGSWFFAADETAWLATIDGTEGWKVSLYSYAVSTLLITVEIGGKKHSQQLAPGDLSCSKPYNGRLSALQSFMSRVQRVATDSVGYYFPPEFRDKWMRKMHSRGRLGSLVDLLNALLHADGSLDLREQPDGTNWPQLQLDSAVSARHG